MTIDFLPMFNDAPIPQYATSGSSGFDLVIHNFQKWYPAELATAADKVGENPLIDLTGKIVNDIYLTPRSRLLIGCGYKLAIPLGYELQVRARSGLALKQGLACANGVGTIDSDYRGEIAVILINTSAYGINISKGMRVAQGIIAPIVRVDFNEVESLTETVRGEGGYGSTGLKSGNETHYNENSSTTLRYRDDGGTDGG